MALKHVGHPELRCPKSLRNSLLGALYSPDSGSVPLAPLLASQGPRDQMALSNLSTL